MGRRRRIHGPDEYTPYVLWHMLRWSLGWLARGTREMVEETGTWGRSKAQRDSEQNKDHLAQVDFEAMSRALMEPRCPQRGNVHDAVRTPRLQIPSKSFHLRKTEMYCLAPLPASRPGLFFRDDSLQFSVGPVQLVVDDAVAVLVALAHFLFSGFEATLDLGLLVFGAVH